MGKMSNAERQRKFRLYRDSSPTKRQAYLEKCKEKYKNDKLHGKRKLVKDMTDRERRHAQKQWRNQKKTMRAIKNKEKELQKTLVTPPSCSEQVGENPETQKRSSRQKIQGHKQINRERAKA